MNLPLLHMFLFSVLLIGCEADRAMKLAALLKESAVPIEVPQYEDLQQRRLYMIPQNSLRMKKVVSSWTIKGSAPAGGWELLLVMGMVLFAAVYMVFQMIHTSNLRRKAKCEDPNFGIDHTSETPVWTSTKYHLKGLLLKAPKREKGFDEATFAHMDPLFFGQSGRDTPTLNLGYLCFSFLRYEDTVRAARVSKNWQNFSLEMRYDQCYMRYCARRGFVESATPLADVGQNIVQRGREARAVMGCWNSMLCLSQNRALELQVRIELPPWEDRMNALRRAGTSRRNRVERQTILALVRYLGLKKERQMQRGNCRRYLDLVSQVSAEQYLTIMKDCTRTLVGVEKPQDRIIQLACILSAYSTRDRAVGYCQGMAYLVAKFLSITETEEEAFWAMHALFNQPYFRLRTLYEPRRLLGLNLFKFQFWSLTKALLPAVFEHLTALGIFADLFNDWFLTLFTYNDLPNRTVTRIWDYIFVEGHKGILRIALALMRLMKMNLLMESTLEGVLKVIKAPKRGLFDADHLIEVASSFKVTRWKLKCLSNEAPFDTSSLPTDPPHHHRFIRNTCMP